MLGEVCVRAVRLASVVARCLAYITSLAIHFKGHWVHDASFSAAFGDPRMKYVRRPGTRLQSYHITGKPTLPDKMCMHAVPFTQSQTKAKRLLVRSAPCRLEREEADSGGVPLIISRLIEDKLITTPTTLTLARSHVTLLVNYRAPC